MENESGTILIEVLVAFAVLIIGIALYAQTIMTVNRMIVLCYDKLESNQELFEEYYLETSTPRMRESTLELIGEDGTSYEFPVTIRKFGNETNYLYDVIGEYHDRK